MTRRTTIGGIQTELIEFDNLTYPVTVADVDTIAAESLDCLDKRSYRVERQARNESVVYTISKNDAFMGTFRICRYDDARREIKYGSINFSDDPELAREWGEIVYGMLCVDIARRIEGRDAARTKSAALSEPTANQAAAQIQPPAPTNAPRTTKWLVKAVPIALLILSVALALTTNVASTTVPEEWKPYSWPLVIVLVFISVLLLIWQAKKTETHNT